MEIKFSKHPVKAQAEFKQAVSDLVDKFNAEVAEEWAIRNAEVAFAKHRYNEAVQAAQADYNESTAIPLAGYHAELKALEDAYKTCFNGEYHA